jgi:hypothetical protein
MMRDMIVSRALSAAAIAAFLCAGCEKNDSPQHGQGERCASECESTIRGRVIVASNVAPDAGVQVSVAGEHSPPDQIKRAAGCLDYPAMLACEESFSLFGGPASDESVQLVANVDGQSASTEVEIRGDSCGHDIAYVALARSDGGISFAPTRYVSPCSIPSL